MSVSGEVGVFPKTNRARGELRARFSLAGTRTEAASVFETGGYRLRMPRPHDNGCDAIIVNTGGGMAGGDHARFVFSAALGTCVTLTTTAAEKIYRSDAHDTRIDVTLEIASRARIDWLPQETILFDKARLDRRLDVTLGTDATLLMGEMLVFGRLAMDETIREGSIRDQWRVRRADKLIFAEDVRLDGDVAGLLDRTALGSGARAAATVLLVSPDAESRIDEARDRIATPEVTAGASAWNGMLVVRALSPSPERLRGAIVGLLTALRGRSLPRTWL